MTTQQPGTEQPSIRIASLHDLDDFQTCVDLQLAVWGYSDGDLIPRRVFLLADRIGGQVLGAIDEAQDQIIGFAMALPGYRDGVPYLHSHMLAVLPEYRNFGLGRSLKLAQRDDALVRGFELMEWTFDPLEIKNAYLNIARLGAICRRYKPDFYGPSSSPLQGGLPTDRLYAEWWLRSSRVVRRLAGEMELVPTMEQEVVVPRDVQKWKQEAASRDRAFEVQRRNREALESAFSHGLAVVDYRRGSDGDGHFLLGVLDPAEIAPEEVASYP